tara:strand:- start:394 stop:618 length:225 start_codon:yes stop_codon:yes gene_type:complete
MFRGEIMSQLANKILENDRLKELTTERQKIIIYINNIEDWVSKESLKERLYVVNKLIDVEILNIKKEIENGNNK